MEYTIDNSTWVTGNVFNNLAAGTYQIWVRNANNSCPVPYVGNPVVLGNGQIPVILSVQTQNPQGCGVQDGSITVNVMGNNLEYSINGGTNFQTSNVFVGLGTGFYPIVVRQGTSSCSALSSATLNAPAAPSITGVVPVATTDCGANNGSITITASTPSGTGALQYSNDGGQSWQTSNVFGALSPGTYTVSVSMPMVVAPLHGHQRSLSRHRLRPSSARRLARRRAVAVPAMAASR